jgi:uncharacterized protein (DUF924 family)
MSEIYTFWFNESMTFSHYFGEKAFELDDYIKEKFEDKLLLAKNGGLKEWLNNSINCLEYIILTDQFPRHIYRNKKNAFKFSHLAEWAMIEGLERGYLNKFTDLQAGFFLSPAKHSENPIISRLGILNHKITNIKFESKISNKFLKSMLQHNEVLKKFGRFPKRNRILGRKNTEEEEKYIANTKGQF